MFETKYDVIVVGGGHAGAEAAAASANLGAKTLLVTMNLQTIGQMSCNPAMGGIAKGQIVREIDALGGYSGIVSDLTAIQFKMLNKSKGPAMWSPRVQSDRAQFALKWRELLEKTPNLDFYQDMVVGLIIKNKIIQGVKTGLGNKIFSKTVILTNGTFLNGLIHVGEKNFGGGRVGEKSSTGITADLESYGFSSGRMKTGTPPRVDGRSLDYSLMEEQPGDLNPGKFSYLDSVKPVEKQTSCHLTHTNSNVHEIMANSFDRSPMFNGSINSTGPRYCPSIEDKIYRFSEKDHHQIFVEPEGVNTVEVYVNGFSTSMPEDVQYSAIKEIKGFKNVKLFRPGYAIEYDYFPPTQLTLTLETKLVENLFFAGQINGTTGYEEAAAQGLMAGINAVSKAFSNDPLILTRSEAYIGVLIDDLITKGTEEPYRMFTSRAEYRTLLRQDNADIRLTEKSFNLGLASEKRLNRVIDKQEKVEGFVKFFEETSFDLDEVNNILNSVGYESVPQKAKLAKIYSRPNIKQEDINKVDSVKHYIEENKLDSDVLEQTEIQIKYKGYIEKEKRNADKLQSLENIKIPKNFDYNPLASLS
ncbi:tRNA uridine-5-carboxymethylaminomethyl(34) synthesis enzyme MnmG, partial [Flavobacteriaceae bacterium]|nr:tRNA uridine-5-carboxymethylaminomethyl(34) synthesis enzyme MnmG [Flavobacteriaceae bacterium]